MIIDFHTHIWPDSIAERAVLSLDEKSNHIYNPITKGTVTELLQKMKEFSIDYSVIQPVVTKESQIEKTNLWAAELNTENSNIVSFGGIWPHAENWKNHIDFVVSLGLKGLKFHPEYQNFEIDAPEFLPIYDYALSKGLILLFHGGFDPAFPEPYKSSPKKFAKIVDAMKGGTIVVAHLGGQNQWNDVEKFLCRTNIFLDTSMGQKYYSREQFLRIVKSHGAEKILFGTDSPWSNGKDEINAIQALSLSEKEKAAILGGNAKKLLNL